MPVWQWKAGSGELWVEAPVRLCAEDALCVCRCEPRTRGARARRRDFPARPARMQAGGINRSSPLYPFRNSRRYWRVIRELKQHFFFSLSLSAAIRLKTFNYACSRQPFTGIRTAADSLRSGPSDVYITLLGRIQGCNPIVTRLRHFNSTLSPSLVSPFPAYKTADYARNPISGLY